MLFRLPALQSRAATAENPQALPGQGGTVNNGMKGSPAIKDFKAGTTETLLDQQGPGMIRHMWMTSHRRTPYAYRNLILRMYWEDSEVPSVEVPWGDFYGVAHGAALPLETDLVCMQEGRGMNSWIPMPFAKHARITLSNETDEDIDWLFYQIDFTLGDEVTDSDGRFHAAFRRENPCPLGHDFTILDTGGGRGLFLGCVMGVRPLSQGWWGEGAVKMYIDDDGHYPTICGTGTEDYIGGAWSLEMHQTRFQGAPLHQEGFTSMYRFHIKDPVYFERRIKVTVQQMGAERKDKVEPLYGDSLIWSPMNHPRRHPLNGYYLRADDWCATAYWYQYPLVDQPRPFPTKEVRSASLFGSQNEEGQREGGDL